MLVFKYNNDGLHIFGINKKTVIKTSVIKK